MAYVTGIANSMADLLAAIQSACTANGWTLTGSVLSKGTCFVQLTVVGESIDVLAGTGYSGSAITGTPYRSARLQAVSSIAITYPATYDIHVHAAPDEVYVLLNYNVTRWGWLAFGQSPAVGIPGTGNWQAAMCSADATVGGICIAPGGIAPTAAPAATSAAIGFRINASGTPQNSTDGQNFRFHHGLDTAAGWSSNGDGAGVPDAYQTGWQSGPSRAVTVLPLAPQLARLPNLWNGETVLLPLQPHVYRASGKVSLVGELGHARCLRNDNLADGEVITLGADRWKAYPWHRKNTGARDGGTNADHSGTLGWAIRYDGP